MSISTPADAGAEQAAGDRRDAVRGLSELLDLVPDAGGDPDRFLGYSPRSLLPRVFGGQVLAQSLVAASRTIEGDRPVHSLHGYFLRPGDPRRPITFAVERLRDGRSFSARRTHALQGGVPILSMITSFQEPAEGLDHQEPMPDVPSPEDLPTLQELYADVPMAAAWMRDRPVDLRHIDSPIYLEPGNERVAHQALWMRCTDPLPDGPPAVHAAALAYLSDFSLLEPVLRRHGKAWMTPGMKVASLDHAMWWHRAARADEWLLYVQRSPSASGSRGLATGELFTRDGVLVCAVAQEGMLRVPLE